MDCFSAREACVSAGIGAVLCSGAVQGPEMLLNEMQLKWLRISVVDATEVEATLVFKRDKQPEDWGLGIGAAKKEGEAKKNRKLA